MGSSSRRRGSFAARSRIALMVSSLGGDAALERGVERDGHGGQRLGDRTVLLRLFGKAFEAGVVDARHVALGREIDAGDAPALLGLIEVDARPGANFLWLMTCLGQAI